MIYMCEALPDNILLVQSFEQEREVRAVFMPYYNIKSSQVKVKVTRKMYGTVWKVLLKGWMIISLSLIKLVQKWSTGFNFGKEGRISSSRVLIMEQLWYGVKGILTKYTCVA